MRSTVCAALDALVDAVAPPGGKGGSFPPMGRRPKIMQYVCAFIVMEQIHCKAVEQRATLIRRQYNRDWGTSYSRPPIDPYLTSPLLQNPGGATASVSSYGEGVLRRSVGRWRGVAVRAVTPSERRRQLGARRASCACCVGSGTRFSPVSR